MKQLLLAAAAVVGLSSAALAAEPATLTDSQLDNVVAGAVFNAFSVPIAGGTAALGPQVAIGFPGLAGSSYGAVLNGTSVRFP